MGYNLYTSNVAATITAQATGDVWIIAEGVYVTVGNRTIDSSGITFSKSFYIDGHLVSENSNAILLGDSATSSGGGNEIHISATGSFNTGSNAVVSYGGNLLLANEGSIFTASGYGVYAVDGDNAVINAGSMTTQSSAIYLSRRQ